MALTEVYPWLNSDWDDLCQRHDAGKLPHAILVVGPAGVGKNEFVRLFAGRLLCTQPGRFACGRCRGCHLQQAGSHPGFLSIAPPADSKVIGVDAVRDLAGFLALTGSEGGARIAIISPADRMNHNAANSLLKNLEEPAGFAATYLFLITEFPQRLPATIRSRCQRLQVKVPPRASGSAWLRSQGIAQADGDVALALARGAPLAALQWCEANPLRRRRQAFEQFSEFVEGRADGSDIAVRWAQDDPGFYLHQLRSWYADMARLGAVPEYAGLDNPDLMKDLQALSKRLDLPRVVRAYDRVTEGLRLLSTNVNPQLIVENILLADESP